MSAIFGSDDGFDQALADADRHLRVVEGGKGKKRGGGAPPEAPPEDLDWADAPFECLGVQGETWWFRDSYHQVIGMNASRLSQRGPLTVLLAGDADGWAARHWPEYDREGLRTNDYAPRKVHKAIAARMLEVGLFDPTMPRRGPGVWLHNGELVVHCGTAVLFPGQDARKPSFLRDGVAYIGGPAIPLPHDGRWGRVPPPSGALALEAEALFGKWNWNAHSTEKVLLGWVALANLGAAPPMRPLTIVDGQEGGGKTTLLKCVAALCPAGEWTDDTTESGLRQRMNGRAAPVVLDEFEGEEQVRVLGLLRRIVTNEGSRSFRGQASQQGLVTEVVGTAMVGAIGAPVANAAEATRILNVMLWPRPQGAPPLEEATLLARCRAMAPALWGRAIAAWPRIKANAVVARQALDRAGCSPRHMDRLGWLIAAREAMVSDEPLTDEGADAALVWVTPWLVTEDEQAEDSTAARCLQHLMASPVLIATAHSETVAMLVARALREAGSPAERHLAELGLRLAPYPVDSGLNRGLYIATGRRPALGKLFAGTEWQSGRWGTVLAQLRRRLPSGAEYRAAVVRTRIRFSGENDRAQAVWLAPELLPGHGHGGEGDAF